MGSCLSNTRSTTTVAATATTATEPPPPPPQAQARTSPTVSLHAVDLSTTPTSPIAITAHHSPSHSHNSQDDDIDNKWPIPSNMAERALSQVLGQLKHSPSMSYADANTLLSKAKLALLRLNALTPSSDVSPGLLTLARETYEQGALFAIRARKPDAFTRYVQQLQPFYELPSTRLQPNLAERNRVTGLSLLLLLTQGRYAEFHSELESLANRDAAGDVEGDKYLGYPIRLERWLMEGSYDRVWKAMKSSEVPCDEYGVFSEILKNQIRSEIASSSEKAYPSLPISSTKSLLFLDSEGDVIKFAQHRGWAVRDGHIYFPQASDNEDGEQSKDMSQMVIENTLGYARELETIV